VISPAKSEIPVTTLSAFAAAFRVTVVVAAAVVDCADTAEPSDGYANAPPADGAAFGGEETDGVAPPDAFGTDTLIAHAVAAAPGVRAGPCAPAEPNRSRAAGASSARRRRTVT
jgi:hypothetical protein